METKIELKGIVRNTSNLNSPPGCMNEIINFRKKLGSWRPILPKVAIKTNFTASIELFIHTMEEVEYFITFNTDGKIKAITLALGEVDTTETLITLDPAHEIKFNSLGDFLIISDLTTYEKYIFRYYTDRTPKYTNVSDIPFINLTIDSRAAQEYQLYRVEPPTKDNFLAGWVLLEEQIRETVPEYFEGYVFLRWGMELIDGTILKQSLPIFLYAGSIELTDEMETFGYATIRAQIYRLYYTIQTVLPTDWANYENLIRGITFFMTKPLTKYNLDESGITEEGQFIGMVEKPSLLLDLFRNESMYYRIHHVPFNKIIWAGEGVIGVKPTTTFNVDVSTSSPGESRIKILSDGTVLDLGAGYDPNRTNIKDITSYDILNVDDVSNHRIVGLRSLNYNSRLFMGDIYTKLFNGYNISYVILTAGGSSVTEFDIYIEVDLATEYGIRTVRQTMSWSEDSFKMPYIIGYPDIRTKQIRILHNSGGTLKKSIFAIESHPILNFAFATRLDDANLDIQAKNADGFQTITIASITTAATLATLNTSLRDKNRVQLTELSNPYVTPALYSYQVGEGEIIALAVNMLPLEDRFGTFPVFVFTSRGVWALNLSDTGEVVVSNIVPVSNAVCVNTDSVIVVDNMLVFLASDGIKLLTGQTPAEISNLIEGPFASVLVADPQYIQIKAQALLNVVTNLLSSIDILTYAAGARFSFDKNIRELIVSNYSYQYSYIYSLDDKMWYKSTQRFKRFINAYPNVYALRDGNDLIDISQEITTGNVPVYFESKPILIGPDKEVKLSRIILGGRFDVSLSFYGALYVFGSNDGSTWAMVTGKEIQGLNIYNIIIPRLPLSLRYVIFVFSGTLKPESSISEFRILT
jgi:hypothetical protein